MRTVVYLGFLGTVCALALLEGCYPDPPPVVEREALAFPAHFPGLTLTEDQTLTPERVALGKRLFFDPILSRDSTVSCASCHLQANSFAEPLATSVGIAGRTGSRNAPHLANIAWSTTLFWDGGVPSLELQIQGPIENPLEMDNTVSEVLRRLNQNPGYVAQFEAAFGRAPDLFSFTRAIAAYERSLISANAPYDRYLTGQDPGALSPAAVRGMNLFFGEKAECFHCHGGVLLTDFTFQNNGSKAVFEDLGRQRVTQNPADAGKFKVPSLRNVAVTAPYMHDGSFMSLEEVVRHYERGGHGHANQSPLVRRFTLTDAERADLLAFLHALTDPDFLTDPSHQALP